MRRAIVHIGMPRSGTTSLQHVLAGLRRELRAEGVLYPDLRPASAAVSHLSHQYLGEALDGRRPRRERAELLDQLGTMLAAGDVDTVLLSYESFALAPARHAVPQRLAALLSRHGYALEVLLTVKPQSEYLNSIYTWRTQFLREGRSFAQFLPAALASRKLRYDLLLQPWLKVAAGRVTAVPTRDAGNADPLLARVLTALGLAEPVLKLIGPDEFARVENRSPGPLAVEASRRLAWVRIGRGSAREVTRDIERRAWQAGERIVFNAIDAARAAAIAARFARSNDEFARQVWHGRWEDRVAPGADRPINELAAVPPDAATSGRLGEIIHDVTKCYDLAGSDRARHLFRRLVSIVRPGI